MHVHDALDQLAEIRLSLAKAEAYRGYRPEALAAAGLLGLGAGWLQPALVGPRDWAGFILYWLAVAVVAGLAGCSATLAAYLLRDGADARRKTRQVAGQFLPCVGAGLAATVAVWRSGSDLPTFAPFLPGLWALLFSLGLFASRPFLPRAIGWVALGFFFAGCGLLIGPEADLGKAGWRMGLCFGVGQLLIALVLQLNLIRLDRTEAST